MTLPSLLAGLPNVLIDRRADHRDRTFPSSVTVRHVAAESLASLLDAAMRGPAIPAAVISDTGRVIVLTAGGSGQVWLAGTDATDEQTAALTEVRAALESLIVEPEPAPKRRRKADSEPAVEEPVVEPVEEPVVEVDGDA